MFDFQKLTVYQKSKTFHLNCKEITTRINEKYVIDQLRRASHSIILNIAEGSAKSSKADRKNYFTIARGSVFECVSILYMLNTENKIDDTSYLKLLKLGDELSKMLFKMNQNLS